MVKFEKIFHLCLETSLRLTLAHYGKFEKKENQAEKGSKGIQ